MKQNFDQNQGIEPSSLLPDLQHEAQRGYRVEITCSDNHMILETGGGPRKVHPIPQNQKKQTTLL